MPTIDEQIIIINDVISTLSDEIDTDTTRAGAANIALGAALTAIEIDADTLLAGMQSPVLTESDFTQFDADMSALADDIDNVGAVMGDEHDAQTSADVSIANTISLLSGYVSQLVSMADPYVTMAQKTEVDGCVTNLQAVISANTARKAAVSASISTQQSTITDIQDALSMMQTLQPLSAD